MDLEFNTKNVLLVTPQALAASAASSDSRKIESKGSRLIKIRVLASGVASGKAVSVAITGGNTLATVGDNEVDTVAPVANASGIIDATYYVKTPTTIYQFLTGEATPASDAGASSVVSVDIELSGLRESSNLTETPELYA